MSFIVVRARSNVGVERSIRETMSYLNLTKVNHAVIIPENDQYIGGFKQKFFSIGGSFAVLDADEQPVCQLQGKWTGWDFRFIANDTEFAQVSKEWAGIGKEMFTSADNYALAISDAVPADHVARQLILAAVMCIDMVLKE